MAQRYKKGTFLHTPNKELLRGKPSGLQSTYHWICDHADENGYCYPSAQKIADDAGVSRRKVFDYLKELETMGVLEREKRTKGNEQLSNAYYVMDLSQNTTPSAPPALPSAPAAQPPSAPDAHEPTPSSLSHPTKGGLQAEPHPDPRSFYSKSPAAFLKPSGEIENVPTDSEGNPKPHKKKALIDKAVVQSAFRLRAKFGEICQKHMSRAPAPHAAGLSRCRDALLKHKLTESQVIDLFEEWFSLGKSDEESVSITRALSDLQIEQYKIRNNV